MKKLIAASLFASTVAFAAPADKIKREDMLEVENIALKLDMLQRQAEQLNGRRAAVLEQYRIGKDDKVDADGTIHRAAKKK